MCPGRPVQPCRASPARPLFGKTLVILAPAGPVALAHRYLVRPGSDQILAVTNLQDRDAAEAPLTAWALADRHGSVHELLAVDSAGTAHPLASIRYDALGVASVTGAPGSPRADGLPVTWTGGGFHGAQVHAATGLVELDGRWYDAAHGRYVDAGPIHTAPGRQNPYEFHVEQPLYAGPGFWERSGEALLDGVQLVLDLFGLIPGAGEPVDALNGTISLARGDRVGAALSAASMLPVGGDLAAKSVKWGRLAAKWGGKLQDAGSLARTAGRLADAARGVDAVGALGKRLDNVSALRNTLRKVDDGIPSTGIDAFDLLATQSPSFRQKMDAIRRLGYHVIEDSTFAARGEFDVLRKTFTFNPDTLTRLDLAHEWRHYKQLMRLESRGLSYKSQTHALAELGAYRFEQRLWERLGKVPGQAYMEFHASRFEEFRSASLKFTVGRFLQWHPEYRRMIW